MMQRKKLAPLVLFGSLISALLVSETEAHSGWGTPFIGGLIAGHVLSNMAYQRREQTQAMQSMAYGGGGGYGYAQPQPYYAAPPQPSPQQQLNTLDQLAAGGYITPQQYQERRQAILNGM